MKKEEIGKPKLKYMNLDWVKMNLRIEVLTTSSEKQREIDNRIAKTCAIAEDSVLGQLGRTADDLMAEYGKIPHAIKAATVLIASGMLEHCTPNPDVIKMFLKPYQKQIMNTERESKPSSENLTNNDKNP